MIHLPSKKKKKRTGTSPVPTAFPLDSLGFGVYPFPVGRRRVSMSFPDPLEGTETTTLGQAQPLLAPVHAQVPWHLPTRETLAPPSVPSSAVSGPDGRYLRNASR